MTSTAAARPLPPGPTGPQGPPSRPPSHGDGSSDGAPPGPAPAGPPVVAREGSSVDPYAAPPPGGPDGSHPPLSGSPGGPPPGRPPPGPGGPPGAPPGPGGGMNDGMTGGGGPPPPGPPPMYRYGPPPPQVYRYAPPPPPHHYHPHHKMPPYDGRGPPPPPMGQYDGRGGPPPQMAYPYPYGPPPPGPGGPHHHPMSVPSHHMPPHMYPPPPHHPHHPHMMYGPPPPHHPIHHRMPVQPPSPMKSGCPPTPPGLGYDSDKEDDGGDEKPAGDINDVVDDKPEEAQDEAEDNDAKDDKPEVGACDDDKDKDGKAEGSEPLEDKGASNREQGTDAGSADGRQKDDREEGEASNDASIATKDAQDAKEDDGNDADEAPDKDAAGQSTVTKPKGENKNREQTADDTPVTATTCNETMSQISPQALNTSLDTTIRSDDGAKTPISPGKSLKSPGKAQDQGNQQGRQPSAPPHGYQTHQKPPHHHQALRSPPQSSPHYSHGSRGSFSQITNPPSASAYYAGPPPPPGSAGRPTPGGRGGPPPAYYQYQHYDPRSHVDAPMPPKRNMNDPALVRSGADPYYGGMVPPTVHMPNAPGGVIKDLSPLNFTSAIKTGPHHGAGHHARPGDAKPPPTTPRATHRESEAAAGMAQLSGDKRENKSKSPLDLLSSVSSSPVAPKGKRDAGGGLSYPPPHGGPRHHPGHGPPPPHPAYSYPPAPSYHHGQPPHHHAHRPEPLDRVDSPAALDATPAPKSSSLCDLILSAANTLDQGDKKRKFFPDDENDEELKAKLLKKAPAPTNLFSVGGYPPGFDPSTLPPSRSSLKPVPKSMKGKSIDPDTITQAQKASMLAQQALERPRVGKQLLLSMALVRTNPRTPPSCYPAHGTILTDRFHWAAFPPLDTVLRKNMKKYYELSTNKCQSRDQQEFNNELVLKIRAEAKKYGWEFDDKAFDDKKIRDRIRCFFKTHIQNAKKRLKTMLRNPEKRANIKALAAHFHLIEEKGVDPAMHSSDIDDVDCEEGMDSLGFGLSQSYSSEAGDINNVVAHTFGNENHHHHHHHDMHAL